MIFHLFTLRLGRYFWYDKTTVYIFPHWAFIKLWTLTSASGPKNELKFKDFSGPTCKICMKMQNKPKQPPQEFQLIPSKSKSISYCVFLSEIGVRVALSNWCGSRLWPFHGDDWFRYSEEAEEGWGFGLCLLITLRYHTGSIYHQTPKASVWEENCNQSNRLHAIHPAPPKSSSVGSHHVHFVWKRRMFQKKIK